MTRNQWGISLPTGWWEWEEARVGRSRTNQTQASDNTQVSQVVLVDAKGRPLVVREPRPVGFRKP
jgi:hypothetical protein